MVVSFVIYIIGILIVIHDLSSSIKGLNISNDKSVKNKYKDDIKVDIVFLVIFTIIFVLSII